ncbi:helix-turn-helix domain-containing protein [Plesiomonas shigelloides]|uniref:helix-turn-helix domain-containing protein n=1 Tax=Plesiomonas shigelloides TaxID=703 RepID=UPI001E3423AB|nr:helix-turn-helix domain-containing protein [Plesiomonas shigelloides]
MSMTLMARAMNIKVGNPLRKLVLIKLADNANDKGECWPSYQNIADHCECSKSAVRAHIEALMDMGLLTKENRIGNNNGKGNRSNVYYLILDTPMSSNGTPPVSSDDTPLCHQMIPPMPLDGTPCAARWHQNQSIEPVIEPRSFTSENESSDTHGELDPLPADGKAIQSGTKWGTTDDLAAAEWMFGQVLAIAPKAKKPNYAVWANEIRLMRERDGKQHREICELFKWACHDSFWSGNILSPAALRRKWDQLEINRNKQASGRQAGKPTINNTDWLTLDDLMGDRL